MSGKNQQIHDRQVSDGKEFAIRCFIDGQRVLTDELTPKQARCFRVAARHLYGYLKSRYLTGSKRK